MDDAASIANAAHNLGACLAELEQYDAARTRLAEARAEALRAGGGVVDILLVEAGVARLQGKPDEAREIAGEVLDQRRPPPTAAERLQVHLIRSEIASDQGDANAARAELNAVRDDMASSPSLGARLAGARARIHALDERWPEAAEGFDREAELWRKGWRFPAMSRALARAARAHRAAGRHADAADRHYRAARSALGAGDLEGARTLVAEALADAARSRSVGLNARVEALSAEIRSAADVKK